MRCLIAVLMFVVSAPALSQVYLGHGELAVERPEPSGCQAGTFGFSQSVLRFDDTLVVGATSAVESAGAVIFHERDAGAWVEQQRLVAPGDAAEEQFFGYALARIGDDLFVGAPHTEVAGEEFAGAVHRLRRDAGSGEWSMVETIEPPAPDGIGLFGYALVAAGGVLYVGSPYAHAPDEPNYGWLGDGPLGGRVYAYEFDEGVGEWVLVESLQGDTDLPGDAFGTALAADTDRLVVGAPGEGTAGEGAIYAFDIADLGAAPTRFADDSGAPGLIRFGRAVSLAGNRLLVGADGDGAGNTAPQGAAHLVEFGAGGPARITTFEADDAHWFGWSVLLLDEQQALVGAPTSAIYHYVEDDGVWSLVQRIAEPVQSTFSNTYFGEVLVFTDGDLFVGAPSSFQYPSPSGGGGPPPCPLQSGQLYEIPLIAPPLADLAVTLAAPTQAVAESEVEIVISVTGDLSEAVSAAFVFVRLRMDVTATSEGCFEVRGSIFRCELGAIEAGGEGEARITVAVPSMTSQTNTAYHVYAGSELADPDSTDNAAVNFVDVLAPPPPPPPVSSGGGSFGGLGALFLLAMLKSRIRLRRSSSCSARTSVSPDSIPTSR